MAQDTDQPPTPRELAQNARSWISSPEGREKIKELLRVAGQSADKLSAARRLDLSRLHKPITL